jgi:hypothetical protein
MITVCYLQRLCLPRASSERGPSFKDEGGYPLGALNAEGPEGREREQARGYSFPQTVP